MPTRKAYNQICGGLFFLGPTDLQTDIFSTQPEPSNASLCPQCFPHSTHHLTTPRTAPFLTRLTGQW